MQNTLSINGTRTGLSTPSSVVSRTTSMVRIECANPSQAARASADWSGGNSLPMTMTLPSVPNTDLNSSYAMAVESVAGNSPPN